jgi:hypothetical protein
MSDGAVTMLAFLAALAGMAVFALSNDAHWRQLLGARTQAASVRSGCKFGGAALLALSFLLCTLADPVSMAILVWPMLLGVAAACVAAFLTVHARVARQA